MRRIRKKKHKVSLKISPWRVFIFVALLIGAISWSQAHPEVKIPILSTLFPNTGAIVITPYVSANGTKLYVNGEQYQFTGINAFSLGSYTGNAGCGGQIDNLDTFFSQLRPNSTVRMWAFQGSMATDVGSKQINWAGLDRVVEAAGRHQIKLAFVLSDQSGTCDDGHWKDKSWYESGYTKAFNDLGNGLAPLPYLDYVKLIVSRYKDSTTIAMWELVNEPEAADCQNAKGSACYAKLTCDEANAAKAMRGFFDTVGGAVKTIDKNHIISSGVIGSGQCGASYEDYRYIHESPGIDVASYHDYDNVDQPLPGDQWNGLLKRLDQMRLINKPLIIGEVGMLAMDGSRDCMSLNIRRDKLKAKMDAQFKAGIAGFMPWDLTGGVSKVCNYDIGTNDPTLTLLHDYPVSMGGPLATSTATPFTPTPIPPTSTPKPTPTPDRQAPSAPTNLTASGLTATQVTLTWTASIDNVGVVRYDIFRNDQYFTSTTGTRFTNTNLVPGKIYTYHVKGKDAAGNNSGSSNRVTITSIAQ